MAAPSFSKDLFSFYVAFYLLQFYKLKDFIIDIVDIIVIALEQLKVHVLSRYFLFPLSLEIS